MDLRNLLPLALIVSISSTLGGQNYFQQSVDYRIAASLDDENKLLAAEFEINYTNNSDQDLSYLIFHLWPNAYSEKTSEFASQLADYGNRDFYFAEEEEMGGYETLSFVIDGRSIEYQRFNGHPDVVKMMLPRILKPGRRVTITGNFVLDIPRPFSRMGHTERSVQLTQWYPKPAVFDKNGWHPMPYLNIGEFYSEFGDYEVSIDCPADYVLTGTGELQNEDERNIYLNMAENNSLYPDREGRKTLTFSAENVHDFALFLDKGFLIKREVAAIESGRDSVECWAFYHEESETWPEAARYVRRAIEFGSEKIGAYPYPQATAVEGVLLAGGGMEYPMVTIIQPMKEPQMLDNVVAHEVFHNWFYGLLATNERYFPWMDEGFTSYYEGRYMDTYYQEPFNLAGMVGGLMDLENLEKALYWIQAGTAKESLRCCHSRDYHPVNYQLAAYTKPKLSLRYLEDLYGQYLVDKAVQRYFDVWKFKHPGPLDVKYIFEEEFNLDMGWLFDDLIQGNQLLDYGVAGFDQASGHAIIENLGAINAPYRISGFGSGDTIFTTVLSGHNGQQIFNQDLSNINKIQLDPNSRSLDINRSNDEGFPRKGWLSRQKTKFHFVPGTHRGHNTIYLYNRMGWNNYDKFMLGLHISNRALLPRKFNFTLNPLYGFGSGSVVGNGDVHYNFFNRENDLRLTKVGVAYKTYHVNEETNGEMPRSQKWSPYIEWQFRGNTTRYESHRFRLQGDRLTEEYYFESPEERATSELNAFTLGYEWRREGGIHPQSFKGQLEFGDYETSFNSDQQYLLLTLEYDGDWYYAEDKRINVRAFTGIFPFNTDREAGTVNPLFVRRSLGLAYQGYNDVFDRVFLGRNEQGGFLAHQVAMEQGGFKTALTSANANVIGNSNHAIASVNLTADLPINIIGLKWIKPFLDLGYFADRQPSRDYDLDDQFLWSSGLSIDIGDVLKVYFPLVHSQNIEDAFNSIDQEGVFERVTFSLNLRKLNFYNFIESGYLKAPN
ncbi:MAG: M1 family metallopeptidase [Saprospiraceae bacterium]|nr:M1 family metallopeptidase [Saprospiraceae bacterium]